MLEWILSSSALILLVLALRALGKSRLSCRVRYALWLPVLVRLLMPPVALFESPISVERLTERTELAHNIEVIRGIGELEHAADGSVWGYRNGDTMADRPVEVMEYATPERFARLSHTMEAREILTPVYSAGAALMAAVLLRSNLRFSHRLRRSRVPCDALCGGMRVYVAEGLVSPCLVGVFRPDVYLTPESTRDAQTLRHVLAHEETHKRHGDCVWSVLRLAALCLHCYHPLVWYAVTVSKRDGELACDEATLARLGEDERIPYGETLLSLVTAKPGGRDLLSASTAMTAEKKTLRERIETIAKHPRTRAAALALACAVLLSATVFTFSKSPVSSVKNPTVSSVSSVKNPAVRAYVPGDGVTAATAPDGESQEGTPGERETLTVTDSYQVEALRIDGGAWSVCVPAEGWTREGDAWSSEAGSSLSVKHLAVRDECDLAPRMEHWDWAKDSLHTVSYEDAESLECFTAYLFPAADGGYWQVLTQYDTALRILSSYQGLEPELLRAMADSFQVMGAADAAAPDGVPAGVPDGP